MWVIISLNLTNLSSALGSPYRGAAPAIALTDERGRRFDGDIGGALFGFQQELGTANGLTAFNEPVRPGISEPRMIGFEVPPDVQRLTLISTGTC
jgi:hypothetical protein